MALAPFCQPAPAAWSISPFLWDGTKRRNGDFAHPHGNPPSIVTFCRPSRPPCKSPFLVMVGGAHKWMLLIPREIPALLVTFLAFCTWRLFGMLCTQPIA